MGYFSFSNELSYLKSTRLVLLSSTYKCNSLIYQGFNRVVTINFDFPSLIWKYGFGFVIDGFVLCPIMEVPHPHS